MRTIFVCRFERHDYDGSKLTRDEPRARSTARGRRAGNNARVTVSRE
jgi:hypothetical protein